MIGLAVIVFAAATFLLESGLVRKYGRNESRRGLTGYEVSRHLLDALGAGQIAVEPVSGWGCFKAAAIKELFLEKRVCDGRELRRLAEAARHTVLMARYEGTLLSFDFMRRLEAFLLFFVPFAWALVLLGAFVPGLEPLKAAGFFFLASVFAYELWDMPRQWESAGEAYSLLKQSGFFEVDELIKIRKTLAGLRLRGLALPVKAPFALARRCWAKSQEV